MDRVKQIVEDYQKFLYSNANVEAKRKRAQLVGEIQKLQTDIKLAKETRKVSTDNMERSLDDKIEAYEKLVGI